MNILVINGPNLNLLGSREPNLYGHETLEELMMWLENCPEAINHEFKFYQSNHEGEIIDIKCDLLIGADGAHSWTRRYFKLGRPKEMMIGFQTEVQGYEGKNRWLEMYSGSAIAQGFFAWVITSGFGSHRIGVW